MQGLKNSPESAKYLAMAMEMYFTLVDDQDADVRMVADENLNRVTRSLGDSSVGRLQVSWNVYRNLDSISATCFINFDFIGWAVQGDQEERKQ